MKWIIGLLDFRLWNGAGQGGGGGGGQGGGGDAGPAGGSGAAGGDPGGPGEGGMGQGGGGDWGGWGDGDWNLGPAPAPTPAPPPPPPVPGGPGWEWAANRQVANIDRTSQYSHEQYTSALETIHQQSMSSGGGMGPGAYDYELPDTAFGERIY